MWLNPSGEALATRDWLLSRISGKFSASSGSRDKTQTTPVLRQVRHCRMSQYCGGSLQGRDICVLLLKLFVV